MREGNKGIIVEPFVFTSQEHVEGIKTRLCTGDFRVSIINCTVFWERYILLVHLTMYPARGGEPARKLLKPGSH